MFVERDRTLEATVRASTSCGSRPTSTTSSRSSRYSPAWPTACRRPGASPSSASVNIAGLALVRRPRPTRSKPALRAALLRPGLRPADPPAALELASRAWAAFRAPQPTALAGIADTRSGELRFLGEAFDRLGREYPSTRDGLSLTERRLVAAVAEGAPDAGTAVRGGRRPGDAALPGRHVGVREDRAPGPRDRPAARGGRARRASVGRRTVRADRGRATGARRRGGPRRTSTASTDGSAGCTSRAGTAPWRWDEGMERVVAVDVHADD